MYSSLWTELNVEHVVGQAAVIKQLDLNTCTLADAAGVDAIAYKFKIPFAVCVSGFAGWFTVDFAGSVPNPAPRRVHFSTGPEAGHTHWGQQVFYLMDPIDCTPDTEIHGTVALVRQQKNKRLYNVRIVNAVDDGEEKCLTYEMP